MIARRFVITTSVMLALVAGGLALVSAPALAAPSSPAVTIDPVTGVGYTTAQLSGTVNPAGGPATAWHFEYSTNPAEGWTQAGGGELTGAEASGHAALAESSTLEGLAPNTTYDVRLVAVNTEGEEATEAASGEPYPSFTTKAVAAPTLTLGAVATFTAETAHFSGTVDPNAPAGPLTSAAEAAFSSAWRFVCTPECPGLEGSVAADNSAHAVAAVASGLQPGTIYMVALEASNLGGTEVAGPQIFTTPAVAPRIASESESVTEVTADSATLGAEVDPGGAATTYHFEYDTTPYAGSASHGQSTPESEPVGEDNSTHTATAKLQGLAPGTTYHYRVVATNAQSPGGVPGPDATFTTEPAGGSFALPDHRAYELVSPQDKNGGDVAQQNPSNNEYLGQSAVSDGESSVMFASTTPFDLAAQGAPFENRYIAVRGADGWSTRSIAPAIEPAAAPQTVISPKFIALSADLSKSLLAAPDVVAGTGALEGQSNLYFDDDGAFSLLTPAANATEPAFAGASADWSHLVFSSYGALTHNATAGENNLYESVNGVPRLVNVLPDGAVDSGLSLSSGFGAGGVPAAGDYACSICTRDISDDGSRVFWTDRDRDAALYLRESFLEGGEERERTVEVNESHGPGASGGGEFWAASDTGSKAFFTDSNELTSNATTSKNCFDNGFSGASSGDLYDYETEPGGPGRLTDLTTADSSGGCVVGVLGVSADGSYVYFVATGNLTPGASHGDLYVFHDGELKSIAQLSPVDESDWREGGQKTAEVSSSGALVFNAAESLTGYDNRETSPGECEEYESFGARGRCGEVFVYDPAGSGSLTCTSCNPTGGRPVGDSLVPEPYSPLYTPRYLSSDGGRVFFDSSDALASGDTNGQQDVYEWEAEGEGTCERAGGCVFLISGGTSPQPSSFLDATPSGDNVFFTTQEQLVAADRDQNGDLYDARVGGGFPEPSSLACSGTGCQGVPSTPPVFATPSSVTFAGVGNFAGGQGANPPKKTAKKKVTCAKGKQRSGGKCLKRKAKSRKKAKAKRTSNSRRASR